MPLQVQHMLRLHPAVLTKCERVIITHGRLHRCNALKIIENRHAVDIPCMKDQIYAPKDVEHLIRQFLLDVRDVGVSDQPNSQGDPPLHVILSRRAEGVQHRGDYLAT
jgi:hypothetical protein